MFNHSFKVAGEIGMLDAISGGRLDCGFDTASLQVNFHRISCEEAASSMRLFSADVMPAFRD